MIKKYYFVIFINLTKLENIKLNIFISDKEVQFENKLTILVTFWVWKEDKSIFDKELHPLNIQNILVEL